MKECKRIRRKLPAYLENDLSVTERDFLKRHLRNCPKCRRFMQNLEGVIHILPRLSEEPPTHLVHRLKLIPRQLTPSPTPIPRVRWVAAIFTAFVLLSNLFYFTHINPRMNRFLHNVVFEVQKITVKTESLFQKIKKTAVYRQGNRFFIAMDSPKAGTTEDENLKETNHETQP